MRRLAVLLAALALAGLAGAPAAQAGKRRACTRANATTIADNALARLYTRRSSQQYYSEVLYGCLKKTDRSRRIASNYDDDYVSSSGYGLERLTGAFVSYYYESYDVSCKAACPPDHETTKRSLRLVDLRSGSERVVRVAQRPAGGILLAARGALAWPSWLPGNQIEILVSDGGGERAVDSGAIHPESLALTPGGLLSWRNEDTPRNAQLVKFGP